MQIREISLTELYNVYELIKELHPHLSYDDFENLIYDMRHMEYKMLGLFERGELYAYAGISVQTTLSYGRHLAVFDFVSTLQHTDKAYALMLLEYLDDYAKMAACQKLLFFPSANKQIAPLEKTKNNENYVFLREESI
jgi:hypothetical protein